MNASYLHHVVIHFPIALLTVAAGAFVVALLHGWPGWRHVGGVLLALGTVAALVAVIAGLMAQDRLLALGVSEEAVNAHRNMGLITLGLSLVTLATWIALATKRRLHALGPAAGVAVLAVVTAGSVTVTGHFGGTLLHPEISPLPGVGAIAEAEPRPEDEPEVDEAPSEPEPIEPEPIEEEFARGAEVFDEECAACHGPDGQGVPGVGGPPVMGTDALQVDPPPDADRERRFETGKDVLDYVGETMPLDDPGGLAEEENRQVVAYLLADRGFDVSEELTDEEAEAISLDR